MARSKASQSGPAKKPATRKAGGRAASEDVAATAEAPDVADVSGTAAAQDAVAAGSTEPIAEPWWDAWVGGGGRTGALDAMQEASEAEAEVVSAAEDGNAVPPVEAEAPQDGDVTGAVAQEPPGEDAGEGAEADSEREPGTEVVGRPLFEALSDAERVLGVRVDLAEAVAIVNAERVHSELEKWQMVADERERSLERADLALDTVARAVESAAVVAQVAGDLGAEASRRRRSDEPSTEPDEVVAGPSRGEPPGVRAADAADAADAAPGAKSNVVEIPVDIRAEARRYAEALRSAERAPKRRTWRNIWR